MVKVVMLGELPPINKGGVGVHIQHLSKEIAKYTDKVIIISSSNENSHIKNKKIEIYFRKIPYERKYKTFQSNFVKVLTANKLLKNIDIIHSHGIFSPFHFLLNNKIPLVITVHGYSSMETVTSGRIKPNSLQFKFMRFIEKKTVERADAVIAVGKTIRKWIIEELGAVPEKVFYVPNGIDPQVFKPWIEKERNKLKKQISLELNIPKKSNTILFTKHFTPRYGFQFIIPALPQILKEHPNIYIIATNEDDHLPKMRDLARKYNVEKNIIFTRRVSIEYLVGLYNIADVFVHPSINEQETFGISLIEAMACELPVIATAIGGPKEILEEGMKQMGKPVGLLIPPKNPKAIADAVIYLLEHPDEARKMGRRARKYVLKNYTWEIVAKKTLEVYEYALQNHK